MSYYLLDQQDVKNRYNDRLKEAANERRARQLQARNGKSLVERLQAIVQAIATIGQKANVSSQPNTQSRPVHPIL